MLMPAPAYRRGLPPWTEPPEEVSVATVPAAVSRLSEAMLASEPRPARVAAVFSTALYLLVEAGSTHDRAQLLPILAPGALLLPHAVRLAEAPPTGWGLERGQQVSVGGGAVLLPELSVRIVRTWTPARVRAEAPVGAEIPAGVDAAFGVGRTTPGDLAAVEQVLVAALSAGPDHAMALAGQARDVAADGAAWTTLAGAGPGLTPSGDDAICGVLLVGFGWGVPAADLSAALTRTTALSAALIEAAAQGYAIPEAVAVADAVVQGDVQRLVPALPALQDVGHTSGCDLLAGMLGAVRHRIGAQSSHVTDLSPSSPDPSPSKGHPR